ncbi:MAG: MFS superfamily sulfate permease-like transporter [Cognaticolwellia sp.]|jgi:MFS superfamily sulfate permease-like transporter
MPAARARTSTSCPRLVLASIIMSAVIGLVDLQGLSGLWKSNRLDFAVAMVAFVATLTLGIQVGMATGVGHSLVAMLWRTAKPNAKELGTQDGVLSVQIEGPLYFGNTDSIREDIAAMKLRPEVQQVRIQAQDLGALDSTARGLLEELESDASSILKAEDEQQDPALVPWTRAVTDPSLARESVLELSTQLGQGARLYALDPVRRNSDDHHPITPASRLFQRPLGLQHRS